MLPLKNHSLSACRQNRKLEFRTEIPSSAAPPRKKAKHGSCTPSSPFQIHPPLKSRIPRRHSFIPSPIFQIHHTSPYLSSPLSVSPSTDFPFLSPFRQRSSHRLRPSSTLVSRPLPPQSLSASTLLCPADTRSSLEAYLQPGPRTVWVKNRRDKHWRWMLQDVLDGDV
jgi:hypothetical protein